jgi:glycosyltransferase involved in cell wall biosynthesis
VRSIKSICFIAAGLNGGGIERAFTTLANHFSAQGFEITLLLLFQSDHFFELGENIKIVEPGYNRKQFNKYFYAAKTIPYIRKNLRIIMPDVIVSYGEWLNPFVILATRALDCPLFISDRMSPDLHLGFVNDNAKKLFYKRASGIIAQTNFAAEVIRKNTGAKNITVIPNPLHALNYPKLAKKNQICTLGRLSKEKGHKFLIEAFSRLSHKDWTLHIIGDGPERSILEKLTNNLFISDRVIFYGHVLDFTEILAQSQIFVLPSLSEGFPNALIEAMSVPLACISSDCVSGPADIIGSGENGILVPPGNVEILNKVMDDLIENPSKCDQLARQAFQIRERLDIRRISNDFLSFISGETKGNYN